MCSYCGCDSIEVIGRFMAEHVEIINATGELRAAVRTGDADTLDTARLAVVALLWPHTRAEEAGLFTVLARDTDFRDHIEVLCGEHQALDTYLTALSPGDEGAMARFENALREHIDKEDNGLFPAAAIGLDGPQWLEVHASTPFPDGGDATHPHDHGDEPAHDHVRPHVHAHPVQTREGTPPQVSAGQVPVTSR